MNIVIFIRLRLLQFFWNLDVSYEKHTLPIRSEQNSISFLDNKSREGKKKKKIRNAIDFARFASTKYTTRNRPLCPDPEAH